MAESMPEAGSPLGDPAEDARWTAWALGEQDALDPADLEALAAAAGSDAAAASEIEALRETASAVSRAFSEAQALEAAGAGDASLSAGQRKALLSATATATKTLSPSSSAAKVPMASSPRERAAGEGRRGRSRGVRWRLPFAGRPLPALAALAIVVFLGIPSARWAMEQSPLGHSIQGWMQQVSSPDSFSSGGSIGRDVIDLPPPRPFVDYLLWRSVGGSGSMSGIAGDPPPPAARGVSAPGLREPSPRGEDARAQGGQPTEPDVPDRTNARVDSTNPAADAELADPSRRIVLSGRMRVEVADVMAAVDEISDWVIRRGGFVESSRMSVSEGGGGATVVLRIPRLDFVALRRTVRDRAVTVLADESDRVDATARHADQRERLRSLRTTEAELRELLAAQREAGRETKDVLEIFDLLKEYRTQIEGLEGQLGVLEEQAALSTLTLELLPHRPPSPTPTVTLTPTPTATPVPVGRIDRIGATAESAGVDLLDGLELVVRGLLYMVIAILPPLVLLIGFGWLWWWGLHRIAAWWTRAGRA